MGGVKKLAAYPSLAGTVAYGWMRDDLVHVLHIFLNALPGDQVQPSNGRGGPHWPCPVCTSHGYTEADFWAQAGEIAGRVEVQA